MLASTHQRYLLSRFHHIDELLSEALRALEPADRRALSRRVVPDATPAQRQILGDYLQQIRFALRRFMDAQAIEDSTKPVSGLWALRTALIFAQTAVVELRPSYLAGYGQIEGAAATACERLVAELTTLLNRVMGYLDKGEQGDLAARLARLDATPESAAMLRELERIITAHGLVELRASLESLIERAATPRYEVAVFGRVSAGKSSLLNWWLGTSLLPTGVTPVTSVLTRIVHGSSTRAQVRVAAEAPLEVPPEQIAPYVTETGNPGNIKRVLEVTLHAPSPRLAAGICLVDTPGLGSLATAGAIQSLEYLPRCDLAVQLIEAGGPVGHEDLELARMVLDGGSELLVALSKADRLREDELRDSTRYVAAQFKDGLGLEIPVDPISTLGPSVGLLERWFESRLAPRLVDFRAQAAAQLRRKIGALRETVSAALGARLRSAPARPRAPGASSMEALPSKLRIELERARSDLRSLIPRLRDGQSWIVEGIAEALAECWARAGDESDAVAERLEAELAQRARDIGDLVSEKIASCRTRCAELLAQAEDSSSESRKLPLPRGRPLFDTAGIAPLACVQRPLWAPRLRGLLETLARTRVQQRAGAAVAERLQIYGQALRLWSDRYLAELEAHIDDGLALEESRSRLGAGEALTANAAVAVRRDLELLARGPEGRGASPGQTNGA